METANQIIDSFAHLTSMNDSSYKFIVDAIVSAFRSNITASVHIQPANISSIKGYYIEDHNIGNGYMSVFIDRKYMSSIARLIADFRSNGYCVTCGGEVIIRLI